MVYDIDRNAYILITTQPVVPEFVYNNTPGYYMRSNVLFKALGEIAYYSDADYYMGNNVFYNKTKYLFDINNKPLGDYMDTKLNHPTLLIWQGFVYNKSAGYYLAKLKNKLEHQDTTFIRSAAVSQGFISNVLSLTPVDLLDRGLQVLNAINLLKGYNLPYNQALLINQASIFTAGKLIKVQRDLGTLKLKWKNLAFGLKIPIGLSLLSYNRPIISYILKYTDAGLNNTIMPDTYKQYRMLLPDTIPYSTIPEMTSNLGFLKFRGLNTDASVIGTTETQMHQSDNNTYEKSYEDKFVLSLNKKVSGIRLWLYDKSAGGEDKGCIKYIADPIYYQILSNRSNIFSNKDENDLWSNHISSNISGNLIKFWIEDVNNKRVMSTPAFIEGLADEGGNGLWLTFQYIGAAYPQFLYKGTQPRKISFTLKLTSFSELDWPYYINKLNFLRGVGFPTNYQGNLIKYYNGGNGSLMIPVTDSTVVLFPQAPIYKMTLGDIIYDQYGYFEAMDISWLDNEAVWNFNPKLIKGDFDDQEYKYMEIPRITAFKVTFVCMYGRAPSNKHRFYSPAGFTVDRLASIDADPLQ